MVKIGCGPVIGLVTKNSANVLLEVDKDGSLDMVLRDKSSGQEFSKTVDMAAGIPKVFVFDALREGSSYDIRVPDIKGNTSLGNVRTLPADISQLGVGFVSCDRPESHPQGDLWKELYRKGIKDNTHVIVHLGDNVYIDETAFKGSSVPELVNNDEVAFNAEKVDQSIPYIKARRAVRGLSKDDWPSKKEEILEIYRQKYREVWGKTNKAKVLANFSNVMILDDHELRNDIGTLPNDSDPDDVEYFLATQALQVYHEYQRQLWDPDVLQHADQLKHEFYKIDLGPVRIIISDWRTTNSLKKNMRQSGDKTYYGKEQTKLVLDAITDCNPEIRMTIMALQLPLVWLKSRIMELAIDINRSTPGEFDAFMAKNNGDEIPIFLDAISKRKQQVGEAGEVIIVGGDLHLGGFTDIYEDTGNGRNLLVRQITSSAIQNKHTEWYNYAGVRLLMNFTEKFKQYEYAHYDWIGTCNFAQIHSNFSDPGKIKYKVDLVNEKGIDSRSSEEKNWDRGVKTTSPCCNIA